MIPTLSPLRIRIALILFILIAGTAANSIFFDRVHSYHSGNVLMSPEDYDVVVMSAEEYKGDHSNAPGWSPSDFKPIEGGAKYVSVAAIGRAHVWNFEGPTLIELTFLGFVGAIVVLPWGRRKSVSNSAAETVTISG